MSGKVHEKKTKQEQFYHAQDNAVASIGKVIKFQQQYMRSNKLMSDFVTKYWIDHLPITHDIDEAKL